MVKIVTGMFWLALLMSTGALGATQCGQEADLPDFEAGEITGSCSDRHKYCRATMLSSTKREVLSIQRSTGSDSWAIRLGSYADKLDHASGLDYAVDGDEMQHIPGEFLTPVKTTGLERSNEKNRLLVDSKLAKIVLQDMLKGHKVRWQIRTAKGQKVTTTFPTRGLNKVVAWISCKQPR